MAVLACAERDRSPTLPRGGAFVVLLLALLPAPAQEEGIYHSRQTTFRIPFQIDPGDRRVAQVILHVSEDLGRSWQQVGTAAPGDKGFNYTARKDGWYYFTVQTMDQERRLFPATLEGAMPGLRVFVDTVAPEVKLRPLANAGQGQIGVEWDLRDEALDERTLKFEYRQPGQLWQERQIPRQASGQLKWDPPGPGQVEVRVQVKDRAGNLGEGTTRVRSDGRPMDSAEPPRPEYSDPGQAEVRRVNSTKISLNFKVEDVGPSDVSIIEIWKTKDTRLWQRYPKDAEKKPPFIIDVDGEGRYGFTLIAKSGVGLGERAPRPGDQPQIWIEVDLTKPDVRLLDVVVGRGIDTGNLTVTWNASDRNLSRQPITLSYATRPEGPWNPVPGASNIENSGRHQWKMPGDVPFEFYLRVDAVDEAGNIGRADTKESVKVDLSTPRARVIGVEPVKP